MMGAKLCKYAKNPLWKDNFMVCLLYQKIQSNLGSWMSHMSNNSVLDQAVQRKSLGCWTKLRFLTWQPFHADTCMISRLYDLVFKQITSRAAWACVSFLTGPTKAMRQRWEGRESQDTQAAWFPFRYTECIGNTEFLVLCPAHIVLYFSRLAAYKK